ncbi:alcohol oxidase [Artomyces pyxidatus]|uniref:Alcohol oxidase n=1 Tax=Artomyces pyxidatus TaxID=48021 RepID=A0ACB8SNH4_9AGAM|nr:alcohol oxidase [Artomyces pyxidatus]
MGPFQSYPELKPADLSDEYDFIIVGGGTAGCVLANRLGRDPTNRVLVVERGGVTDSWASRVPLFSSDFASDGSRTLKTLSEHQQDLGKRMGLFTGRVLGGTSRINGMLYSRGLPAEYDAWQEAGRQGWGWEDLKPYFLKSEHANYAADPSVHSQKGEWYNSTDDNFQFSGFGRTVEASRDIGLPYISDINSPEHPPFGCGRLHFTRDKNGYRNSTYHAFLPKKLAVERRSHLHVCTYTAVSKVETERFSSGQLQAVGVKLVDENGKTKFVRAKREVVLCEGTFGSPQWYWTVGALEGACINVVKNLPFVGSKLQDHFGVSISFNVPISESLVVLEKRPWILLLELFRYLIFGTGLLLAPVLQLAIFTSSQFLDAKGVPSLTQRAEPHSLPDIETMLIAYETSDETWDKSHGVYNFLNVLLRPASRGTVRLTSQDPFAPLSVVPRYLSDPADYAPLRASLRLSLRIAERMRARGYQIADWRMPEAEDDATLDRYIRRRNRTTFHYASTCRMAPEDDPKGGGVVSDTLVVYAFANLRVADASIFPWVPGTHLQAPAAAVGEKCADMILENLKEA